MPNHSESAYQQLPYSEVKTILKELQVEIDDFLNIVFHGMDCKESKKAALFAYWIVKLRPIMITDPKYINADGYNNKINEFFAIHYMLCALTGMGRINQRMR